MTKAEFLAHLEEILGLSPGTVVGSESLRQLDEWDSLAVVSFLAFVKKHCGVRIPPKAIADCQSADDLWALVNLTGTEGATK